MCVSKTLRQTLKLKKSITKLEAKQLPEIPINGDGVIYISTSREAKKQSFFKRAIAVLSISILKWIFSTDLFRYFKSNIILWLPSFFGLKKREKKMDTLSRLRLYFPYNLFQVKLLGFSLNWFLFIFAENNLPMTWFQRGY